MQTLLCRAAASLNLDYQVSMVHQWAAASDEEHDLWPTGPFAADSWMRLTDSELAELTVEMTDLLKRWATRPAEDDSERRTVFVFAHGVPGTP